MKPTVCLQRQSLWQPLPVAERRQVSQSSGGRQCRHGHIGRRTTATARRRTENVCWLYVGKFTLCTLTLTLTWFIPHHRCIGPHVDATNVCLELMLQPLPRLISFFGGLSLPHLSSSSLACPVFSWFPQLLSVQCIEFFHVVYRVPATGTRSPRIAYRQSLWMAGMWHATGLLDSPPSPVAKCQNGVDV